VGLIANVKALFDTNILVDYLNGVDGSRRELGRYQERLVSIVTWMELLAGAHDAAEEDVIDMFLRDFRVVEVTRLAAPGSLNRSNVLLRGKTRPMSKSPEGSTLDAGDTRDHDVAVSVEPALQAFG